MELKFSLALCGLVAQHKAEHVMDVDDHLRMVRCVLCAGLALVHHEVHAKSYLEVQVTHNPTVTALVTQLEVS